MPEERKAKVSSKSNLKEIEGEELQNDFEWGACSLSKMEVSCLLWIFHLFMGRWCLDFLKKIYIYQKFIFGKKKRNLKKTFEGKK